MFDSAPRPDTSPLIRVERKSRFGRWLLVIGLFAAVWGARLAVIERFGSDLPRWDQWEAEGTALILPYEQHRLHWADIIRPHNEHRIVFTRALALGLYVVNGRWDARLECVVNAALAAALAVAAFLGGCRVVAPRWHGPWLAFVLLGGALPVAWDNIVSGFHSQQFFLIGFSIAGIALLNVDSRSRTRWCFGVACLTCALFAMGSGLLAAVACVATWAWTMRSPDEGRAQAPALIACVAIVVFGGMLQIATPPADALRAQSIGEFLLALARYAQWPFTRIIPEPWSLFLLPWLWAPWLGWRIRRRGTSVTGPERVLFAVGLWTMLQMIASAYARGAGAPAPASRYVDTLVIGLGVAGLALARLVSSSSGGGWRRRILVWGSVAVFACAAIGMTVHATYHVLYRLPLHASLAREYESSVRAFLVSDDANELVPARVSHAEPRELAGILRQPEIRAALPASVRAPGTDSPLLSRLAHVVARGGIALTLAGLTMIGAAIGLGSLRVPRHNG